MPWSFSKPDDICPTHINVDDETSAEPIIIETPYTGCAWCGDGDQNGICPSCEATRFPQKQKGDVA